MELTGKKVLVLGGAGLVGQAICKLLAEEQISELTICSLFKNDAEEFADEMKTLRRGMKIHSFWGNIFVRHSLKDMPHKDLLSSESHRRVLLNDLLEPLNEDILKESTVYKMLNAYKPDIVIDSINTASGIAYQNIFGAAKEALGAFDSPNSDAKAATERLICTQYLPQLIRHVQIFLQSMVQNKTRFYLKIGTCGTGGMGLNIPYTHSEDKPSQMLLSKSAVAGGHSLLMFLMARTPGGPIIKELKPAAAIAWKNVSIGPIKKKGKEILLEDVSLSDAVSLGGTFSKTAAKPARHVLENGTPKPLVAPFIDTGENGLFSLGEFDALTEEGQMEFITPEEIAKCAIWEIKGLNTGHDIVAALDNSTMGPTYRAGYMREKALNELKTLVKETGVESVAFEQLGPPRLSKLLYEAHLLKLCFGTFENAVAAKTEDATKRLEEKILSDAHLRSLIVSIGIPILLSDGKRLLRGSQVAIPAEVPGRTSASFDVNRQQIDKWAHDGWVDLRADNVARWQERMKKIICSVGNMPENDTSSFEAKGRQYWQDEKGSFPIVNSKLASWIFINEEEGIRMKG